MANITGDGAANTQNDTVGTSDNYTMLAGGDTVYAGAGTDTIYGGNDSDLLYGGGDNDTVYGDAGTDTLYGDAGNDILFGGNDTLADTLYGGDNDDTLDGGQGSDRLFGGNGNDLIFAGAFGNPDADSLDGAGGQDTVSFEQGTTGGVTVTLVAGAATVNPPNPGNTDTLTGIEHIIGTNFDDNITGDTVANILYGGANDDVLSGGDNSDTLYGGTEADTVSGDAGADLLYGGAGGDSVSGGAGADLMYGDAGADNMAGGTEADTLYGGTEGDTVAGDAGADLLYGDAGADNMAGGADADTLYGGTEGDTVAGDAGADILYGDAGTDTVQGGDNNDILYGGTEADRLQGGNNDDTLYGGDAADSMSGDAGNDVMVGGAGADTLDGGTGTDTADYSGSAAGVNVTINASGNTGGDAAGDTLAGIENLIGSNSADTLVGDAGNNVIEGRDGADTINAAAGNDTVLGGVGADTIDGGTGSDSLSGGNDADSILGGTGNDTISGDIGADIIDGGTGNDSISGGSEADTIQGGLGNDTIDGGTGDDFITAGPTVSGTGTAVPLEFNWSEIGADNTDITNVTQDTGGINVNVTLTDPGTNFSLFDVQTSGNIYVDTVNGETFNPASSGELRRSGNGDPTVVDINFSAVSGSGYQEEVENVQFRISDIDDQGWRDRVVIKAWDADGNPIDVVITETSADIITVGSDTIEAVNGGGNTSADLPDGSVLVTIAGPVARIEISYDNLETDAQVIYVSDIQFDGILVEGDNDSVTGGDGNDTILGNIGLDTLLGGTGNDVLYGGADNDSLNGNEGNDTILGDAGTDTLRGAAGNDTFLIQEGEVDAVGNDVIFGGGGAEEGGTGAGEDTVTDYDVIDLQAIGTDRIEVVYTNTDPENLVGTIEIYQPGQPHTPGFLMGVIEFSEIEKIILCFTPGTMISTGAGAVAVETLRAGDMVMTRDNGLQPLRWTGARKLSYAELQAKPDLQPVRIAKGALAEGPARTMLVSPQHRVMIEAAKAEMLFGEAEVLVPAKHLVGQVEASRALPTDGVTYIHLLFDRHEMVLSDGIWTESFQPAERSLNAMDDEVRAEILELFPDLRTDADGYQSARLSLKAHEAKVLLGK